MYIRNIEINNFRNINKCNINPHKKINFICGCNAQGKTNLIESIFFASIFKSFRTNIKTDLIKEGEENLFIKIEISNNGINNKLRIGFDKNKKKKIFINEKENKFSHEILNSIIYYPDEISHLKSSPSYRRNLIDRSIFFINNDYLNLFRKYLRCLKQRNYYLKNQVKGISWIREIIKPTKNNINIQIPDEYINKKLEFIIFPLDEDEKKRENSSTQNDIESLGGVFSKYADPSKRELEDKAWEMHVMDKYKWYF